MALGPTITPALQPSLPSTASTCSAVTFVEGAPAPRATGADQFDTPALLTAAIDTTTAWPRAVAPQSCSAWGAAERVARGVARTRSTCALLLPATDTFTSSSHVQCREAPGLSWAHAIVRLPPGVRQRAEILGGERAAGEEQLGRSGGTDDACAGHETTPGAPPPSRGASPKFHSQQGSPSSSLHGSVL